MNKITILQDHIILDVTEDVRASFTPAKQFEISRLELEILASTHLELSFYSKEEMKLELVVMVKEGVHAHIYEKKEGKQYKVQSKYYVKAHGVLQLDKFFIADQVKEMDLIYLREQGAIGNVCFSTICTKVERYNVVVYHQAKQTKSDITNHAITLKEGSVQIHTSSFVDASMVQCEVHQNSEIINLNQKLCQICPNLYIDEYDVSASHSAYIGPFKDEILFYLQSRGISYDQALSLLIKGFLLGHLTLEEDEMLYLIQILNRIGGEI